ncbi:TolC family protein [Elizabethkingia anophelis]|uniref:Probable efflux pump outer membrane protein ttgC n=1 Tax=Elizabethkingia anophelis TaxID=1117645 RepID=A0A7Z7LU19_9FLAO|nr:TolC family protein [Elizabethkingia anophelis]MCT3631705.1 TolC family protein [Elizabethkingia anophelis]MCT3635219.1 TolC family protein [Elizabethkingia anophelis]MCT3831976.1 TolC family protein [Elizabethkingia anophelis]MCT3885424.1 TolC family protein [Elizabethkingia anophelis]MCT3896191.1 TolC family protein [Elizabethkingia anophelis]
MFKKLIFLSISAFMFSQQTEEWDLQKTIDYAISKHPTVQQSILKVDQRKQEITASKGMLLPSVSASTSQNYSFGSTINPGTNQREALNVGTTQFSAIANWELFNWRNFMNISLSKMNKESSDYRLKAVQNDIALNVIQLFFQYQNDKALLGVLKTQLDGVEEQIKRTEKEVEIGNRPKSDIYDIKANMGTLQEQWISAKNQKEISKNNLLNALAINSDNIDFVQNTTDTSSALAFSDENFVKEMLEKNPAYLAAAKDIQASAEKIRVERSGYLPTLNGQYSWSTFYSKVLGGNQPTTAFSDQFNQNKNQQVYFNLSIPVFNKLQVKSNVEIAKLNKINADLEKEKTVNNLVTALKAIKIQYQNSEEKYRLLQQNFENQKLSFEKSEEKYKEGLMDAYTFFVVRNNWLQANFNLIKSRYDVMLQEELWKIYSK